MNCITKTLVAAVVPVAFAASASAQNLVVNPGFELDDTTMETPGAVGWNTFNAAFTNQVLVNSGVNAFKTFGTPGGAFQDFPVLPGETVDAGVVAANPDFDALVGDQIAAVNLEFYDVNDMLIGGIISNNFLTAADPADSMFVQGLVSSVAPDDAVRVRLAIVTGAFEDIDNSGGVSGGGAPFFDDAFLVITPVPEPATAGLLGLAGLAALRRRRV
jgi:hypothetical protein